jgi:D-erythronate 2-dehydrogenase
VANVLVTGGAGFLGARVARQLLATGTIRVAGGAPQALGRLTVADRVAPPPDLAADDRVDVVTGDLADLLIGPGAGADAVAAADIVFHLAAAVSGECEADFDLGMQANLHATHLLLESCRRSAASAVVVLASSLAVFGGSAEHPLPAVVDDQTAPNPQSSYGAQKVICEQLLADYTRKGFLRGRAVRLMTVSVRPGRPNAAASGFLSGIIREPLAGQRATCPVGPETEVALASPASAVRGLLRAASASDQDWADRTPVNLPGLSVTVGEIVAALEGVAGPEVSGLIDWIPDPAVAAIITSWPSRFSSDRAARLGLVADPDFSSIIAQYLAETSSQSGA